MAHNLLLVLETSRVREATMSTVVSEVPGSAERRRSELEPAAA